MEILNVIEGVEITSATWVFMPFIILIFVGVVCVLGGVVSNEGVPFFIGIVCLVIAIAIFPLTKVGTGEYNPMQYEVIITDPNYVIDATKYKIIEQRGKIIVLEEVQQTE